MRRTTQSMRFLWGGMLLALLVVGFANDIRAQIPGKALLVPLNSTYRLQMSTKKPIDTVTSTKPDVIAYSQVQGDPSTIILIGKTADVTKLTLKDVDGKTDIYDVVVQIDVEYLKTQLRRAVPSANIIPIPYGANGIILTGTVARAEDVQIIQQVATAVGGFSIVNALRVGGVQQVQLDVVVAQVSRQQFRQMAFNFLTDTPNTFFGSTIGNAVTQPIGVGVGTTFTVDGALTAVPGATTNLLFGILHNTHGFLGFLQALRTENVAKELAQPSLTTMSGTPASFQVGGQQAIPEPGGLGTISITYKDFGTELHFLPIVLGNGKIHLEIEPKVSSIDNALGTTIQGTTVPGFLVTTTHATVELESGQTFVMAGFVEHSVQGTTIKTPIIGDLPFLGAFFSTKSFTEIEQELVILVTPHLVDPQDCDQLTKCLPGQESRSPGDFELFLEGILEAPRGPRQVFQGNHYVPAFKNGPTNDLFPCAGGRCGVGCGAASGRGTAAATVQVPAPLRVKNVAPTEPVAGPIVPASHPANVETPAQPASLPPANGTE